MWKKKLALDVYDKLSLLNIKLYGAYLTAQYCCRVSRLTGEINSTAAFYCQTANQNKSMETILAVFSVRLSLSAFPEIIEEQGM